MEIFWRSASYFDKIFGVKEGLRAHVQTSSFCHIFRSACSHTRKAAKLYGKTIQCSCKTLGINLYFWIGKLRHKECG